MSRDLRPRTLLLALLVCGALLISATSALAGSSSHAVSASSKRRAHVASSYLTGIGDEQTEMFTNPLWQQLHTKITRYIAPYDAAVRPYSLTLATQWIKAAEAQHQQILVAFYHSEYTPTKMPSIATYQSDVQKFIKIFPKVRQYQPWNESNRGNVAKMFDSPSAVQSAEYYKALKTVCKGCTILGLDVLDQDNVKPTLSYIAEFKREIAHLKISMPNLWGLHNYSDTNRFSDTRTRAILAAVPGEVWLTETGGLVKFGGAFPNKKGSGLTRAAKALSYMFKIAGTFSRIKRLYIYDWTGGTASTTFDAGLMNAHYQPRPGYVIVCERLRAAKCKVKVAKN
jgi:hypothetical protein